jgi:hypothetical protein
MADPVSKELRKRVAKRAGYLCEYCLIAEADTFLGCEVDHIISLKHGGKTEPANLAYACTYCNRYKGTDIASLTESGALIRLYNPRNDRWKDHFRLETHQILPVSNIGEVTIKMLRMNRMESVLEREALHAVGRFPGRFAIKYLL